MLTININRDLNIKNGIIITQVVSAKLSPDTKSNDAFVIHEGLKVKMEDRVDNWVKVRLNDGKIGWLPENDIAQI
jgi:SH3-like domain-containing protein